MYKNKLTTLAVWYSVAICLPLLFNPTLLIHWQIVVLLFSWGLLTMTEPALPKQNTANDPAKRSVVLLAWASTGVSICLWAYWRNHPVSISYLIAGASLMATGIFYRLWAIQVLGRFFSQNVEIQPGHCLISNGLYRFVRHPTYAGSLLIFFGQSLFLGQPLLAVLSVGLLFLAYRHRIEAEEILLSRQFGQEYDDYRQGTKKMIPFIY